MVKSGVSGKYIALIFGIIICMFLFMLCWYFFTKVDINFEINFTSVPAMTNNYS